MTYWQKIVSRNPALADDESKIKISVRAIRELVEASEDHGFQRGMRTKGEMNTATRRSPIDHLRDIIDGMEKS